MAFQSKLISVTIIFFILQWIHLHGFLRPTFLPRRSIPNIQVPTVSSNPLQVQTTICRLAKRNNPVDDFLDDDEDDSVEERKENNRGIVKKVGRISSSDSEQADKDAEMTQEEFDDEFFGNYFREKLARLEEAEKNGEKVEEEERAEYQSQFSLIEASKLKANKKDDGVRYDDKGKVVGLSVRVNQLLKKLAYPDPYPIADRLLKDAKYRAEFIKIGSRYFRWKARRFQAFLDDLFDDPAKVEQHLQRMANDPDYKQEFEEEMDNLDEQRIRIEQDEANLEKQLKEFTRYMRHVRKNDSFAEEHNELMESDPEYRAGIENGQKVLERFAQRRMAEYQEWRDLVLELSEEKNNTELAAKIKVRLEHDKVYEERFRLGYTLVLKYESYEELIEETDVKDDDWEELPTVVVPEGFLVREYAVAEADRYKRSKQKVILQLPEHQKYATYSDLPPDGRMVVDLRPYENLNDRRKSDLSKIMVTFPDFFELQIVDKLVPQENDQFDFEKPCLGILKVPSTFNVLQIPATHYVGPISKVVAPKDMKVVRLRPDSYETEPGEVVLLLPENIKTFQEVGTFPESTLFISARLDKKDPEYYLSQDVTIGKMLPEEAERFPYGMLLVPPLTAVTSQAHELMDYEFKKRYLSSVPATIREDLAEKWDFVEREEENEEQAERTRRKFAKTGRDGEPVYEKDPHDASFLAQDIKWPRTFEQLDALKGIPKEFPVYCLIYYIKERERNDLLTFEYDTHEQYARSFSRLIYHDIIKTEEYVTSTIKVPNMEGLFHFFVGEPDEWEQTLQDVEEFIAGCPLKASGKVAKVNVLALHEIDGERGRVPQRFRDPTKKEEELPEKEQFRRAMREYDLDVPPDFFKD